MTYQHSNFIALLLLLSTSATYAQTGDAANSDKPEVEEITVYGIFTEPDSMTGSAHRISEELLESFQYTDINRVLNFIPGIYSREEDGVGLRPNIGLRGGSAERSQKVTLMEDGVPISPAPYSAPAAYFFPLTSRMVGVEVFKGPSSIQYGPQTIGGALNLISAPIPEATEVLAEIGGGSHGHRQGHLRAGTQFGQTGILGEYVHMGSDGFKELDGGGDTGFEKNEFLLKASQEIGPGKLELRWGYADEVSNETYLGLTESDFRETPFRRYRASELDRMEWDWTGGRANWTQPLFGGQLRLTAYTQSLDRAWRKFNNFNGTDIGELLENPDGSPSNRLLMSILRGGNSDGVSGSPDDFRIGTNDRSFESSGVQGVMQWEFSSTFEHNVEVGLRYHTDEIRRLHDEYSFEQINGEVIQNSQPRLITADNSADTDALAVWLRDEMVYGAWTLVPGLRVESIANNFTNRHGVYASNDNEYTVVLPGLGARYEVNHELSVIAGVHKGFSPAAPSAERDHEPEESVNYEFGGRWHSAFGKIEAIGFFNDYSNLTAICTLSSGCSGDNVDDQTNAGEVHTSGLEFGWNNTFDLAASFSMPINLSYTYTEAVFQEPFESVDPQFDVVEKGFHMPYIPRHRANLNMGISRDNWNIQLSATYTASMRNQAGRGAIAEQEGSDAYTVLDLAAYYDFSPSWRVSGRIDNLLDEEYVASHRPYGARPGKPLSMQWELMYRFQ